MADIVPRIKIELGDITRLEVQAVVTAANEGLRGGGGVDGAVHRAAGPKLLQACREVAPCPTGQSRITPGFDLNATWVIHTVGPVYHDGNSGESDLLAAAYRSALQLAAEHEIESIAFPCISTGVYGYPSDAASQIAFNVIRDWIDQNEFPVTVVFCCFGEHEMNRYQSLLGQF